MQASRELNSHRRRVVSIHARTGGEEHLDCSRVFVVVTRVQGLPDGRQVGRCMRPAGVVRGKVPVHEGRVVCGGVVPLRVDVFRGQDGEPGETENGGQRAQSFCYPQRNHTGIVVEKRGCGQVQPRRRSTECLGRNRPEDLFARL